MKTPLTRADCFALLKEHGTPDHVVRHCVSVADAAMRIGEALNDAMPSDADGDRIDIALIERAALLHDIARVLPNHGVAGAAIVAEYDTAAAEIIADHMNHDFPDSVRDIRETDIVSLADRSVHEDRYIGFRDRMQIIMERFADNPEAVSVMQDKMAQTERLIAEIERIVSRDIDEIATGGVVPVIPLLRQVERPGRYIGGEIHSARKDPRAVAVRFGFVFPDLYEIGMSYTGLQIIYGLLNALEDVYCERVFAPAADMEALLREQKLPLFTLETHTDVKRMDIVGFTLQYEQSYTNVINLLELAGIPPLAKDRAKDFPLIIAGGPCAYNPEPLADVFDVVAVGDGEEQLPEICKIYDEYRNRDKEELLKALSAVAGVYIPSFYTPLFTEDGTFSHFEKRFASLPDRVAKHVISDLDAAPFSVNPIIPFIETVHDRAVVELFRGCGRGCRFCQAGFVYRPVRRRSREKVRALIDEQLACTGYDEVSLLSLSTGDYPDIGGLVTELMDDLKKKDVTLSLPSLRLDSISRETLQRIGNYKKSGLTFAPEAGTQRLRDVVRKNITEEQIMAGVEKAIEIGWNRVKFYFMVGLPTETHEDLDGIVELAAAVMRRARSLQEPGRRNFNLTVSVSNFVPKPHTPFQWMRGNSEEELREKNFYLKDRIKRLKGVHFQFHDTRASVVEMLLAKGDRRTLHAVMAAVRLGCKFDSWSEHFNYELWVKAFETAGLPFAGDDYTTPGMPLPWDIIDDGTPSE
ncbi:MAG: TIGR03960 family B12-binding radical SAM protein, partial [Clostridiales Family XIII bacterium]|nr:TIGR03960 family B12-binding radical SAM protein [Clostridiales Family XIII bacterium]